MGTPEAAEEDWRCTTLAGGLSAIPTSTAMKLIWPAKRSDTPELQATIELVLWGECRFR